jgi:hypothetical protein
MRPTRQPQPEHHKDIVEGVRLAILVRKVVAVLKNQGTCDMVVYDGCVLVLHATLTVNE